MKKTQVAQLEQANADLLTELERGRGERELLRQEAQREKAELVGNIWRLTEQLKAVAAERSASRQHEERLAAQAQRVPGLEQEVAAMRAERDALRADQAEHTLHSMRHTLLWRVMAPLRTVMGGIRFLVRGGPQGAIWAARLPKVVAMAGLRWSIRFVRNHHQVKRVYLGSLGRIPWFDSRVRTLVLHLRRHSVEPGFAPNGVSPYLSGSAKRILAEMRHARESQIAS